MSSVIKCSFFGHRKIAITSEIEQKVKLIVEELIINKNVSLFLFGSRSDFNYLCLQVVSELKDKYPHIKRIEYTCKNETCILESEREKWENIYSKIKKDKVTLLGVEEEYEHKTKYTAGKASYIERNQAMIDDSDYCVFYIDENYQPSEQHDKSAYLSKKRSGTKLAYAYAQRKRKKIINVF